MLDERINQFAQANPENMNARKLRFVMKQLIHSGEYGADSKLANAFKFKPATVLSESLITHLKSVNGILNDFKAKNSVLDSVAYIKTAQAPETILANRWNDITGSLLKTLQFTPEEINKSRIDREIAGKILRNKFESIVSNDETYSNVVGEIQSKLSELQSKMATLEKTKEDKGNLYQTLVNSTFNETADSLRQSRMGQTAEALVGYSDTSKPH